MLCKQLLLGMVLGLGLNGIARATEPAIPPALRVQLPPPPSTPPPNRTRSGGSLSDATACTHSPENLLAIVPTDNPVFTTSTHPTFLFYVPYGAKDVQSGEFSILVGLNEMARLYHAKFTLPSSAGIVSVKLPATAALAPGTFYHWYFKLYCAGNTTPKADLQVNGWVQRLEATPERDRQIQAGAADIWYDALASLADRLATTPQDADLRERWRNLLTAAGMAEMAQEPIVGEVIPLSLPSGE